MSGYDGLTMTEARPMADVRLIENVIRAPRAVELPSWVVAGGWGVSFAAIVIGASLGGLMLLVSFVGIVGVLAGLATTALRWRRADRATAALLAERRASFAELRSL